MPWYMDLEAVLNVTNTEEQMPRAFTKINVANIVQQTTCQQVRSLLPYHFLIRLVWLGRGKNLGKNQGNYHCT